MVDIEAELNSLVLNSFEYDELNRVTIHYCPMCGRKLDKED